MAIITTNMKNLQKRGNFSLLKKPEKLQMKTLNTYLKLALMPMEFLNSQMQ